MTLRSNQEAHGCRRPVDQALDSRADVVLAVPDHANQAICVSAGVHVHATARQQHRRRGPGHACPTMLASYMPHRCAGTPESSVARVIAAHPPVAAVHAVPRPAA
jgi:hypothetical protein